MEKKPVKIVTIGGGSSYTPELMEGFIKRYEEMPIAEIWLVDIEAGREKLEIVGAMAQRMWDATDYEVKIHLTLDRREALKDADFVTTQFRVGLLDARIKDERIPLSYGLLGQETNGAGGMLKAFRTIPVILDIVADMKELCPEAWLINFTNPSGMVTEAVIKYGGWEKCIGLCNVPVSAMMLESPMIDMAEEELIYQFAGLNHFHWHRISDRQGNDKTQEMLAAIAEGDVSAPANIFTAEFVREHLLSMESIPCPYHRYYYAEDAMLEHSLEEYNGEGTRGEVVKRTEAELFELYKNPELAEKPQQLEERGGAYYSDAACECINSIYNDKQTLMVVSTKNRGALPDLPEDAVSEVSSFISGKGALPVAWGKLAPAERGWVQVMKAMEECTIEAAITGDYGLALQAFMLNPLVTGGNIAKRVLDELLIAHEAYLPQFAEKIAELKATGIEVKDEKVRGMLVS